MPLIKYAETQSLEVRVLDDGFIQARRTDRKALTDADYEEAIRVADSLRGIMVDDVLRIFPGAGPLAGKGER